MELNKFRLSVEEMALAINLTGQPEVAKTVMESQLGVLSQESARERLLAAGHSLMARNLLEMDVNGDMYLEDSLAYIAQVLSHTDLSLRYHRSYSDADILLTFHFKQGNIFEHRIEKGVVHQITKMEDENSVVQGGLVFFELGKTNSFDCQPIDIPYDVLDNLKSENSSSILYYLAKVGITEGTRMLLAEDLSEVQYRGSVLRIEYGENNVPQSNEGLLVLRGPERLWLLRPFVREGERYVTLLPGTEEAFRREIVALL